MYTRQISGYILIISAEEQSLRVRYYNSHVPPAVRLDDLVARFPLERDARPRRTAHAVLHWEKGNPMYSIESEM